MRCKNGACTCMCHVDVHTHVPVCAQHGVPLEPSDNEDGHGFCRACYHSGYHAHIAPRWWGWMHRDNFDGADLPPWNGYRELAVPEELS